MRRSFFTPIVTEQGAEWILTIQYVDVDDEPVDLAGYSARMHIRRGEEGSLLFELLSTAPSIVLGQNGLITMKLTDDETASIPPSDYADPHVYDLILTDGSGKSEKVIYGTFVNLGNVTT
jgi:hypothetical protein